MYLERFRLDGRVAIVTGAGRGIGAGCAVALAEAGADVALTSRTESQLQETAAQVEALGRRAVVVPADIMETADLERIVATTVAELGGIDILVNNAGNTTAGPVLDTTADDLDAMYRLNVLPAFSLSKAVVPHLLARDGGSIVNITSMMGRIPDRGFVAYGSSKAAMIHMTRLLALDFAPRVRVNGIAPGTILTDLIADAVAVDEVREHIEALTPLRHIGDVGDIALACLYLASDAGKYLTGKILEVDGGCVSSNADIGLPDL
jgi:7-alpha-hydroxysteroid dehydrogenase